jgi:hypothetical protein
LTHFFSPLPLRRPFGEQAGKKGLDHGGTGPGWGHNTLRVAVNLDKVLRHFPAFIDVTAIESRLSAASLARVEFDLHAALLENLDGAQADLWEKLINEAGDKKGNFHNFWPLTT